MTDEMSGRCVPRAAAGAPVRAASWRYVVALSVAGTVLALLIALAGTRATGPGVPPWPRFWATAFFVLLLWPAGLSLLGHLAGLRIQGTAIILLLAATTWQQSGAGSMPLPLVVRWSASLAAPGDALRQRIRLPGASDPSAQRAWQRASRAAVVICTWQAVAPEAAIMVTLNGASPAALDSLPRSGRPDDFGWYALPVTASLLQGAREADVLLERLGSQGPAASVCGGQDDPSRPGAGTSRRRVDGRWSSDELADQPLPLVGGRPATSRYYIELRLYDAAGKPSFGVWY